MSCSNFGEKIAEGTPSEIQNKKNTIEPIWSRRTMNWDVNQQPSDFKDVELNYNQFSLEKKCFGPAEKRGQLNRPTRRNRLDGPMCGKRQILRAITGLAKR